MPQTFEVPQFFLLRDNDFQTTLYYRQTDGTAKWLAQIFVHGGGGGGTGKFRLRRNSVDINLFDTEENDLILTEP